MIWDMASEGEIQEHDIHNGASAGQRRADPDTRLAKLRDGSIPQPCIPEFRPEPMGLLPIATPHANPLANVKDHGIAAHLFPQGINPCIHIADRALA